MNLPFISSLVLIVICCVLYHLLIKTLSTKFDTFPILFLVYLSSAFVAGIGLWLKQENILATFNTLKSHIHLVFMLGASLVGIELGFIWAYRSGWSLGIISVTGTVIVTVVLFGIAAYSQPSLLTLSKVTGLLFAFISIYLMST